MEFSLDTNLLECLLNEAAVHHKQVMAGNFKSVRSVGTTTIPIPFFGDIKAYVASKTRILTVGLNPSNIEFSQTRKEVREFGADPNFRFDLEMANRGPKELCEVLSSYFKRKPYSWFDCFRNLLSGLDASYYDDSRFPNRAIHIDACSPIATSPTWSKLNDNKNGPQNDLFQEKMILSKAGRIFFVDLIKILRPHLVMASISKTALANAHEIFETNGSWEIIYPKPKHKTIGVRGAHLTLEKVDFYAANGAAGAKPLQMLSYAEQNELGKLLMSKVSKTV